MAALGSELTHHTGLDAVPLRIQVRGLLPLAIYTFTITDPPGGRAADELKIQLIAPGQKKGERGTFMPHDPDKDDAFVVILGYSALHDVFALFDAYKHQDFTHSKNCQVRLNEINEAVMTGLGERQRTLAGGVVETIITARPSHLREALAARISTT